MNTKTAEYVLESICVIDIVSIIIGFLEPEDKDNKVGYIKTGFYEKCIDIPWEGVFLGEACSAGYIDIVRLIIGKGSCDWNYGLWEACVSCHIDIVKLMIENGADEFDDCLYGACKGGNIEIVNLVIKNSSNKNWDWGLYGACDGGHVNIVQRMIDLGADDWRGGLQHACGSNNTEIARLMIKKGANVCDYCYKTLDEH